MKKFAGMFYGRLEAYAAALENGARDGLAGALQRNFYPENKDGAPSMLALADYMFKAEAVLNGIAEERIETGLLQFPDPAL